MVLFGGLAAYPAAATGRLPWLVAGLAIAAWSLLVAGLVASWAPVVGFGLAVYGAEYAVFLRLRGNSVDSRAPFVAAGLIVVAELAFHVVSGRSGRAEGGVVARALLMRVAAAAGAALVGGLVLVASGSVHSGLAFEAVGVVAAAVVLAAVVRAARTREAR